MAYQATGGEPEKHVQRNGNDSDTINGELPEVASPKPNDVEKPASPSPPVAPAGPSPPPDGGLDAWLQVAAGFVIFFNTWGMLSSFAVYQTYYESGDLFQASSSEISWIGSIQCYMLQLTGVVAGPIYDRGYFRSLLVVGGFMIVFGHMMLSLCTVYWQALLAQAFCTGIGAGLLFVPTVSLLPTWFGSRLGLAIGIASSGSSLGGVIYPIVLHRLIGPIGFAWAVRVVGFIVLATFIVPLVVMRMRVRMPKPRDMVDWSAFTDIPFMTFTLAVLVVFIGQAILIFYNSYYPLQQGFTDESLAFYMTAVFNAASTFGRIFPNALSDRIGVFNTLAPTALILGVTILCLLGVKNEAGIIVETIVTGFFSGAIIALPPVCFRILTENRSMIGTRMGQGFAICGLGLLLAGPSAGAILGDEPPLHWTNMWVYAGVTVCGAAVLVAVVRVMRVGFVLKVKA